MKKRVLLKKALFLVLLGLLTPVIYLLRGLSVDGAFLTYSAINFMFLHTFIYSFVFKLDMIIPHNGAWVKYGESEILRIFLLLIGVAGYSFILIKDI